MSVQKKSLVTNRETVQKAIIASKPDTTPVGEAKKLKGATALKGGHRLKGLHRMKYIG